MIDRVEPRRDKSLIPAFLSVGTTLTVGAAVAFLPEAVLAALIAAMAMCALLLLARHYVNQGPRATAVVLPTDSKSRGLLRVTKGREKALVPARYLFYAGMLTLGQSTVRPYLALTVSDWLFFGALCAALAGLIVSRSMVSFRIPALIIVGVALYVVSGMVSSIGAASPLLSAGNVARVGYVTLVWFWLGTAVLTRGAYLRTAVAMWVASIAIDGVGAILQAKGVPIPFLGPVMSGRMSGFTDHVNNLGGPAAVAMAPAFALAVGTERLRARILWIVALLLIVVAAVLSGSVAGMAAGVGAIVVWLFVTSCGARPLLLALAAVALALALSQMQGAMGLPTPVERVLSVSGLSEGGTYSTVAIRLRGFDAVWATVGEGGWLGHGADAHSTDIASAESAHNMLLKAWYEAGWAGAMGLLSVVLGGVGGALLAARLAMTRRLRQLATSLFAAVAAFFVFSLSAPVLTQRYGWISVALALSALAVARADMEDSWTQGADAYR